MERSMHCATSASSVDSSEHHPDDIDCAKFASKKQLNNTVGISKPISRCHGFMSALHHNHFNTRLESAGCLVRP